MEECGEVEDTGSEKDSVASENSGKDEAGDSGNVKEGVVDEGVEGLLVGAAETKSRLLARVCWRL
jgi:hypothetical protein